MIKILIRVLKKLGIEHYFNTLSYVKLNNRRITIPTFGLMGRTNLYTHSHELWLNELLIKLIEPTYHFIDVGVNIGQTLIRVKSLFPNIEYTGFEPNYNNLFYVQKLIQHNDFSNIRIVPCGLSDENKLLTLYYSSENDAGASIISGLRTGSEYRTMYINTHVFDDINFIQQISGKMYIKIDVEGAELKVLTGMSNTIERLRPIIQCEVLHSNPGQFEIDNNKNEKIVLLLEKLKYKIYSLNKDEKEIYSINEISKFPGKIWDSTTSDKECDYILIPNELSSTVQKRFI